MKKNTVKKNLFKTINTKDKAYWLGFILADGYVPYKQNRLRIELSIKDLNLLKRFKKFVGGGKIYFRTNNLNSKVAGYYINNKIFVNNIKKHNIVSPKSNTIRLMNFNNNKLNLSFLLGFYDGDGTTKSPNLTSSSFNFLQDVKNEYKLKSNIKIKKKNVYDLYLGIDLLRIMQKNYKNSLKRKRCFYNGFKKCDCKNNILSPHAKHCIKCSGLSRRKVLVSPKTLKHLINNNSLEQIGKMFGVSGNAIKKHLKKHNIKNPFSKSEKINNKQHIIKLYNLGKSFKDISKIKKLSCNRIREIIREYKKENNIYTHNPRKHNYKLILKVFKKHKNYNKTAKELGMNRHIVRKIVLKSLDK